MKSCNVQDDIIDYVLIIFDLDGNISIPEMLHIKVTLTRSSSLPY